MERREFMAALCATPAVGLSAGLATTAAAAASESDAAVGIRTALERGALAAVSQLGRTDGFLGDARVRIPLPAALERVAKLLRATGQGRRVDELVTAMNRAAEAAVPEAKALFVSTVKAISVDDALKIVRGGPTSATDYFASKTRVPLGERFLPIVTKATEHVQLAERYNSLVGKAAALGLVRGDATNVQQHVTARALDGLYLMIGDEERQIRADPVKTGSAILRKVFGGG